MRLPYVSLTSILALAVAAPAAAQEAIAQVSDAETTEEDNQPTIVVQGTRLRGQLQVDQPPVAAISAALNSAIGASSIADLLDAIAPSTGSARGRGGGGRPIFLINGIRVSGWREFRSYPPEAVAKVEVFSEEVAQRFGYSADQRVVNIVLKPDFKAVTLEGEFEMPDRGGYSRNEQEVTYLAIGENSRLNLTANVQDTSVLTEAERGLVTPGREDEAAFRSLIADTSEIEVTANYARALIDSGTSLSLNLTGERADRTSLSGLADNGVDPLERRSRTDSLSFGSSINKPLGDFNATLTTDAVYSKGRTEIDRRAASGFDLASTRIFTVVNKGTLNGFLFDLPAGEVSTSLDLGFDWRRYESDDSRSAGEVGLTRRRFAGGSNIVVPIAERGGAWGAIGTLSLAIGGGVENLSDFGTLGNWNAGLNWGPFDNLTLTAARFVREVAPGLAELGNPRVDEFNVPVFDYRSGQSVIADVITGGNPGLRAETQKDWKFGANWELPFWKDTRLQVDYAITRSSDVTLSSPAFTAAFEQAFPDRVERDGAGELLAIDRRPVTLYRTKTKQLAIGLNTRGSIGQEPERPERGEGPSGGPGGGRGEASGRGSGPGGTAGFDPARFAELREKFCSAPEGTTPDISGLPERMRARLLDEAGNPDPAKIAEARQRMCSVEGEAQQQRFAAMREALCAEPPALDRLPEEMLTRLRNEAGEIDPGKLAEMRQRICSAAGGQSAGGEGRRGGGGGGRGGGMPFGPGGGDGDPRPRYFASLNYTYAIENEVQIGANTPVLDQLAGEVLSGGAAARHGAQFEGGLFWQGYGLRLSGRYTGKARVLGDGLPGSGDLYFSDLATFDMRLFADLGQALKQDSGFWKGFRVALVADNIFDARRSVTDANGDTPFAYEPFRIDPRGRYLGIDLRKQF